MVMKSVKILIWLVALICARGGVTAVSAQTPFIIYLECIDNVDQDVTISFDRIGMVSGNDTTYFTPNVNRINSLDISGLQLVFAEGALSDKVYDRIIFYIKEVSTKIDHARLTPKINAEGYPLLIDLHLAKYAENSLFIKWQPNYHEVDSNFYRLNFSIVKKHLPPIGSLLLVTNSGSQSLTVVDRNSQQVVKSIVVGQNPTEMIYLSSQRYVYVLITGDNVICVVDLNSMELIKELSTNYNSEPIRLVLSGDEKYLYVLNKAGNSVTVYDAFNLLEISQYLVDFDPTDLEVNELTGQLFVSSGFNEYFSVIDANNNKRQLNVERVPAEFILIPDEELIISAGANDNSIAGYNLNNGATKFRVKVCDRIENMIYNHDIKTLYASIPGCTQISYIKPQDELEINTLNLKETPGRIATDLEFQNLYVTFPGSNKIGIYNINSRRLVKFVPVGEKPYTVLVPN